MNAQVATALQRANEIRLASYAVKREVAALPQREGFIRVAEVLEDPDLPVQRLRVDHLIESIRRIGPRELGRILGAVEVQHLRLVGPSVAIRKGHRSLTEGQRFRLAAELRRRAA